MIVWVIAEFGLSIWFENSCRLMLIYVVLG